MTVLTYRSVYAVQRRWGECEADLRDTRRRLAAQDLAGVPIAARAVAGVWLQTWAGYAAESAGLASGFVLALSAADYTFRGTDGFVADQFLAVDGRLGPTR